MSLEYLHCFLLLAADVAGGACEASPMTLTRRRTVWTVKYWGAGCGDISDMRQTNGWPTVVGGGGGAVLEYSRDECKFRTRQRPRDGFQTGRLRNRRAPVACMNCHEIAAEHLMKHRLLDGGIIGIQRIDAAKCDSTVCRIEAKRRRREM